MIVLFRKLLRIRYHEGDKQLQKRSDEVKAKTQKVLRASNAALQQIQDVEDIARRRQ